MPLRVALIVTTPDLFAVIVPFEESIETTLEAVITVSPGSALSLSIEYTGALFTLTQPFLSFSEEMIFV